MIARRKRKRVKPDKERLEMLRNKVNDSNYLDNAISELATDLSILYYGKHNSLKKREKQKKLITTEVRK